MPDEYNICYPILYLLHFRFFFADLNCDCDTKIFHEIYSMIMEVDLLNFSLEKLIKSQMFIESTVINWKIFYYKNIFPSKRDH